jgi:hypothetical protein
MIVYYRIIGHVIHPQIFILLRLLIDVCYVPVQKVFTSQNLRGKVSGSPEMF